MKALLRYLYCSDFTGQISKTVLEWRSDSGSTIQVSSVVQALVLMRLKPLPLRTGLMAIALCFLTLTSWFFSPPALAVVQVRLFDLGYKDCPPELAEGTVNSGDIAAGASCFLITGQAENKSGKTLVDADVFGRIYDVNNNIAMQNRTRLGSIDTVPPGISPFELRVSVPEALEPPLRLEQFKSTGFSTKVR